MDILQFIWESERRDTFAFNRVCTQEMMQDTRFDSNAPIKSINIERLVATKHNSNVTRHMYVSIGLFHRCVLYGLQFWIVYNNNNNMRCDVVAFVQICSTFQSPVYTSYSYLMPSNTLMPLRTTYKLLIIRL